LDQGCIRHITLRPLLPVGPAAVMWHAPFALARAFTCFMIPVLGLHAILIGGSSAFIAYPKPWKRPRKKSWNPGDAGLNFEMVRLTDGCTGWLVEENNRACAICLCHGRSRHKGHLRPLIQALAAEYSVMACDFHGHGENPYGSTTLGMQEALTVDLALELLAKRGYKRVILYGCSMGGAAVLISQARRPNALVHGVITDGTFASFSDVVNAKASWLPACMQAYMVGAVLSLTGCLAGYDPWSVEPVDFIEHVKVPVLLLHGDSDRVVPPEHAVRLAGRAANATLLFYPGGHDHPESSELHEAIRKFASRCLE